MLRSYGRKCWPSQANLKGIIKAIDTVAYAELGSVSLLVQQMSQEKDFAKKQACLNETIAKLKQLQSNIIAHEEYVKFYNQEHFFARKGHLLVQ